MNEQHSKARQTAEKAFDRTKAQSAAREHEELDLIVKARQEKTARLREQRLAMESQNAMKDAAELPGENVQKP